MYLKIYVFYFVVQFQGTLREVWGTGLVKSWIHSGDPQAMSFQDYRVLGFFCLPLSSGVFRWMLISYMHPPPTNSRWQTFLLESCIFLHTFFRLCMVTPLFLPSKALCLYPSWFLARPPLPLPLSQQESNHLVLFVCFFAIVDWRIWRVNGRLALELMIWG